MNVLFKLLPDNLPVFLREKILSEMFEAAAGAFERPAPALDHPSYDERLRSFALFLKEQAENTLQSGRDVPAIKTRLYQNAYPLGK